MKSFIKSALKGYATVGSGKVLRSQAYHATFFRRQEMENLAAFHKVSDQALEELFDGLHTVEDKVEDADITLSMGVLNLHLGEEYQSKAWVINKQTPNRQIWWSSPISGPRRYEFIGKVADAEVSKLPMASFWRCTKDTNEDLWSKLQSEIFDVTGVNLSKTKK